MKGQQILMNFYSSVKFANPGLAAEIHDDVVLVALGGLVEDKLQMQDVVERLRRKALDMPVIYARVLDNALEELGYDLRS